MPIMYKYVLMANHLLKSKLNITKVFIRKKQDLDYEIRNCVNSTPIYNRFLSFIKLMYTYTHIYRVRDTN